jgi:hypothetical protein
MKGRPTKKSTAKAKKAITKELTDEAAKKAPPKKQKAAKKKEEGRPEV